MIVSRSVGVALALLAMPAFAQVSGSQPAASAAPPTLDFDFFKARIEPIFTTKRGNNARCISCHGSGTPMRLKPLPDGAATWSGFKRIGVPEPWHEMQRALPTRLVVKIGSIRALKKS